MTEQILMDASVAMDKFPKDREEDEAYYINQMRLVAAHAILLGVGDLPPSIVDDIRLVRAAISTIGLKLVALQCVREMLQDQIKGHAQ